MSSKYLQQPTTITDQDINVNTNGLKYSKLSQHTPYTNAVTQLTSVSTGVTLNAESGYITMFSTNLAASTGFIFLLNNNLVQAGDYVDVKVVSNATSTGGVLITSNTSSSGNVYIGGFVLFGNNGPIKLFFQVVHAV
jgi:hypothetical protein